MSTAARRTISPQYDRLVRFDRQIERLDRTVQPFLRPDFYFVNVGANDGVVDDPVHPFVRRYGWRGLLVEPVPYVFEQLVRNYRGYPGISFENAAITPHEEERTRPFWYVEQGSGSIEYIMNAIGSFDRERVLGTIEALRTIEPVIGRTPPALPDAPVAPRAHDGVVVRDDVESHVRCTTVPCMSFNALMAKHDVGRVDLLNIDTEGFDIDIFASIDFARYLPPVVCIETTGHSEPAAKHFNELTKALGYQFAHRFCLWSSVYVRPSERRD